eukprot:scaffold256291_cov19-Tisochrysis_lutea.AAC.1
MSGGQDTQTHILGSLLACTSGGSKPPKPAYLAHTRPTQIMLRVWRVKTAQTHILGLHLAHTDHGACPESQGSQPLTLGEQAAHLAFYKLSDIQK